MLMPILTSAGAIYVIIQLRRAGIFVSLVSYSVVILDRLRALLSHFDT